MTEKSLHISKISLIGDKMQDWIVTILVAIVAIIPGIYALLKQRKKDEADVKVSEVNITQIVQDIYQDMLSDIKEQSKISREEMKEMNEKLEEMLKQNVKLTQEVKELKEGVKLLVAQLVELGHEPRYNIKEE